MIGVAGYARSGKSTVGQILEGFGFRAVGFADRVRDFAWHVNPWVLDLSGRPVKLRDVVSRKGWEAAKEWPEIRLVLQHIGDAGRVVLETGVWVDALFDRCDAKDVVVCDVRFANEVSAVRRRGGRVWWVDRPGVGPVNGHVSERSLSPADCDATVLNDGSLVDLMHQVLRLL